MAFLHSVVCALCRVVCLCVCVRERERERERKKGGEKRGRGGGEEEEKEEGTFIHSGPFRETGSVPVYSPTGEKLLHVSPDLVEKRFLNVKIACFSRGSLF